MSTRTTALDERYGRTPTRRRRGRIGLVVGGAVIVLAVVVWSIWTGIGGSTTALDVQTTDLRIVDAQTVDVQWLVTGRQGTELICAIEATDANGAVVGLAEVVVPVTGQVNRTGATTVRTVRLASNGLIDSCRDA